VGGSVPNVSTTSGAKLRPDPLWHAGGIFSEGAGFSSVYPRPRYQDGVARRTGSRMRSDRYIHIRAWHAPPGRPQLWLGVNNRGPLTASGIYQIINRRERECGVAVYPHQSHRHISHTWLDRSDLEGDLMELNGWFSPADAARYGASARARRTYDRIMTDQP